MEVSLLSPGHSPLTSEAPPHPGHSVFSHLHNEPLVTREQCLPSAVWEEAPGLGTFSEGPSLGPGPHQHGRPVPIWARRLPGREGTHSVGHRGLLVFPSLELVLGLGRAV